MIGAPRSCAREMDVVDLVTIGQWPARADKDLRAHAQACAVCADVARVALVMAEMADATSAEIRVPDASAVWYRAEARSRQERARKAALPMTLVVVATMACVLAVAGAGWWLVQASVLGWWDEWAWASSSRIALTFSTVTSDRSFRASWNWAAAAILAWAAVIPVAFYLARAVDRGHEARHE